MQCEVHCESFPFQIPNPQISCLSTYAQSNNNFEIAEQILLLIHLKVALQNTLCCCFQRRLAFHIIKIANVSMAVSKNVFNLLPWFLYLEKR